WRTCGPPCPDPCAAPPAAPTSATPCAPWPRSRHWWRPCARTRRSAPAQRIWSSDCGSAAPRSACPRGAALPLIACITCSNKSATPLVVDRWLRSVLAWQVPSGVPVRKLPHHRVEPLSWIGPPCRSRDDLRRWADSDAEWQVDESAALLRIVLVPGRAPEAGVVAPIAVMALVLCVATPYRQALSNAVKTYMT